ncbi:hypothetical protein MHYP_G00114790 [Metynnis hypsauchen]
MWMPLKLFLETLWFTPVCTGVYWGRKIAETTYCFRLSSDLTCLTTDVLNRICGPSMRNYRLIFCHNLKQP